MANCMYCGTEIPKDSTFCPKCGKKQVRIYTQTFRREKMSEDEFVDRINQWFAQYPYVGNVKGKFLLQHKAGLMVNKYMLDAFAIEYELFSGTNEYQYAVVKLTSTGMVKTDTKALIGRWQQSNPGAQLVTWEGGVNQRGSTSSLALGGVGAVNKTQAYVFFKFKRALGTAAP